MYWLAVFAIIMEIVFRVRDFQAKFTENNNKGIVTNKRVKDRSLYSNYEKNEFQSNWPYYEYLDSETTLNENHFYRIKNERDNLFLTMTAVEIKSCIYRIISLNGTKDLNSTSHTVNLDPQNRAYSSQLWKIEKRGQTNYLVPANIINLTPKDEPPQDDEAGRTDFLTSSPTPDNNNLVADVQQDSNDYQNNNINVNADNPTPTDSTTTIVDSNADYNNQAVSANQNQPVVNNDPNVNPDYNSDTKYQASVDDSDYGGTSSNKRKRSLESCGQNETKMIWKLKWKVVKTSSILNLRHGHFEIRGLNRTCIIFNGFIGECGRPESSWTFYSVFSVTSIPKFSSQNYFPSF